MTVDEIVKVWKDPKHRQTLSEEQRLAFPSSPVGIAGLEEIEFLNDASATGTQTYATAGCCGTTSPGAYPTYGCTCSAFLSVEEQS